MPKILRSIYGVRFGLVSSPYDGNDELTLYISASYGLRKVAMHDDDLGQWFISKTYDIIG